MTDHWYFTPYFTGSQQGKSNPRPYFVDNYGILPVKCPFCGHRQDIMKNGANCDKCGGDVLHENVR